MYQNHINHLFTMKNLVFLFFSCSILTGFSQSTSNEFLDSTDLALLFTEEVKNDHAIRFPIYRVYTFTDEVGSHQLVLTERLAGNANDSIEGFCFLVNAGGHIEKLEWKILDFIEGHQENIHTEETAIWFWTKFLRLEDLDKNGAIDPIIVYGTKGDNGVEDGRLKILLFKNGEKIGIRHQNSPMDFGRFTKVDARFYELSSDVQTKVKALMGDIYDSGNTIFPASWQEAMKAKKLKFDEN